MQLRSTKLRGVVALAAGALAAGAMTVPMVALAPQAQAASGPISYTCNLALTGGFSQYGGERAATLTFDTDAPEGIAVGDTITPDVTATLTFAQAYIDLYTASPVNRMGGSLTATTSTGGAAGTATIDFAQWNRVGAMGTPITGFVLNGTGSWGDIAPDAEGDVQLGISTLSGNLFMGTSFSPANTTVPTTCTPDAAAPVVDTIAVTAPAATEALQFSCNALGNTFAYNTDAAVTAVRSGANVAVKVTLTDPMPNTAPVTLTNQSMAGSLDVMIGSTAKVLTGSHLANMTPGVPIPMPAMTGSVATTATSIATTVKGFDVLAAGSVPIACDLSSPVALDTVTVPKAPVVTPPKPPAVSAACTAAKTKSAALSVKAAKAKKKFKKAKGAKKAKLKKKYKAAKKKAAAAKKTAASACR